MSQYKSISESEVARLQALVVHAWNVPDSLSQAETQDAIVSVLRYLEAGTLRVASPKGAGPNCGAVAMNGNLKDWEAHSWVKQAVLLTLRMRQAQPIGPTLSALMTQGRSQSGHLYFDKLDVRCDHAEAGVRVVPPGTIREGAHVASGCIVMPGYVNVGAYVSAGSMVDTWATVGSCAQIGKNVHLAGGVGIGGVLEPPNATPVIIGDEAFIGSRAIVVEGAIVESYAVLGANVCITASTPIYDVTTTEKKEYRGYVPKGAVVAPGTRAKQFPGGEVQLQCAYIIAYRSASTDQKVALNQILRETGLSV